MKIDRNKTVITKVEYQRLYNSYIIAAINNNYKNYTDKNKLKGSFKIRDFLDTLFISILFISEFDPKTSTFDFYKDNVYYNSVYLNLCIDALLPILFSNLHDDEKNKSLLTAFYTFNYD
jgi:hypothetical protein